MLVPAHFANIAALSGGGGAFSPSSLSPDLWIEADATTLFTDLGTTNVTTDGQTVEQWNDKSTSARNLTNVATPAARPTYKTDLSKPSLLFNGHHIDSSTGLAWVDGSGQHWFALSCRPAQTASAVEIAVILSGGGGYIGDIYQNTSAHLEIQNTAAGFEEDAQTGIVSGTDVVIIGTATTTQLTAYVDNSGTATALSGSLRTNTGQMVVGGQSSSFNGRLYGLIHGKGTLSSTDRSNLQTYLAALHP